MIQKKSTLAIGKDTVTPKRSILRKRSGDIESVVEENIQLQIKVNAQSRQVAN